LQDFAIAAHPVSRGQFLEFVKRAYLDESVWLPAGWEWVQKQSQRQDQWLDDLVDRLDAPVQQISAHEAEAFCRFASRRLPSEFEWEVAAGLGRLSMTGQVWEWTSSAFLPYAGFMADPYREYSQPWFGDHRVLKGGSWATHSDLKRPAFRNFYRPERTDVFAGFRTCAL
jgi:gamma-glutamyl hercynylcysteine S-oxide synthase